MRLSPAVIGLCVERGPQVVVALLGIIKVGCAYLPLDPDYPSERVRFMLDDAGATVLLSELSVLPAVPVGLVETVLLDEQGEEIAGCEAPVPAATRANGSSLAYVMYTSGSTGQPKGVLIPQRAVTRLVRNTNYVDIGPGARLGHVSNVAFDAATFEFWGALLNGATVELVSRDELLDLAGFSALLRAGRISMMFLTVSLFNRLARSTRRCLVRWTCCCLVARRPTRTGCERCSTVGRRRSG